MMRRPSDPKAIPTPIGMERVALVAPGFEGAGMSRPLFRLANPGGSPVLLIHGGSASSETFGLPDGGLARYLHRSGFDVFAFDWSASEHVSGGNHGCPGYRFDTITMDACAAFEIPAAVAKIREILGAAPERGIAIVGHCFGAGVVAMSIAAGHLEELGVDRVVLLTLGLHYEVPWDGVLKADDHLLERIRLEDPSTTFVSSHPDEPWPEVIRAAHATWPAKLRPVDAPATFERLTFMFGLPYLRANVDAELFAQNRLATLFGPMQLRLYQHGVQNVRRGFAADFDAPEVAIGPLADPSATIDAYLGLASWRRLRRVTLITGAHNALWHPDGIRNTYEHLRRALPYDSVRKLVLDRYAHQDLLWGRHAISDVFPSIARGL